MQFKYDGKHFYNWFDVPKEIRLVNRSEYSRLGKLYGAKAGGAFWVDTPAMQKVDVSWAPSMLEQLPQFGQSYLASEDSTSGLDAQYEAVPDGVVWNELSAGMQDVYQVSEANAGLEFGPPSYLDGRTFTRKQLDELPAEFLSHAKYAEMKKTARNGILHSGRFLLQAFVAARNPELGFTVPVDYFVVPNGQNWLAYCTEYADRENELGRYFYDRERFPPGLAGELEFQLWTASQIDYWRFEGPMAIDIVENAASNTANAVGGAVGSVVGAAAGGLEHLILSDPLLIAVGVVAVGVVVFAATR